MLIPAEGWPVLPPNRGPIPHGLVSLWDMINFSVAQAHSVLGLLESQERSSRQNAILARRAGDITHPLNRVDEQTRSEMRVILDLCRATFSGFQSGQLWNRIRLFADRLEFTLTWSELHPEVKVLIETIEHDLREEFFYHYKRSKADKLRTFEAEWGAITKAFPDVGPEAWSAVDCYALGHDTASVFHSMRVAEHGLRALVKERKVTLSKGKPVEWEAWQKLIDKLTEEATLIGKTKPPGVPKDRAVAFYNGSIADLNGFKDEYRNLVMHVRATYDEHQALRALERVHHFMARVSERIDHRHHRIRWGF